MIKLINKHTNTPMWVADERVNEYLAAGHKSATELHAKEPAKVEEDAVKEVKKSIKKEMRWLEWLMQHIQMLKLD